MTENIMQEAKKAAWERYQETLIGLGLTRRVEEAIRRAFLAGWDAREQVS